MLKDLLQKQEQQIEVLMTKDSKKGRQNSSSKARPSVLNRSSDQQNSDLIQKYKFDN